MPVVTAWVLVQKNNLDRRCAAESQKSGFYQLDDPHFVVAAVRTASHNSTGAVFSSPWPATELGFINCQPSANWVDSKGQTVELTDKLPPEYPVGAHAHV